MLTVRPRYLAVALIASLAVLSCAPSTAPTTAPTTRGGTITVALAQEPTSLDPALSTSLWDRQVLQNVFAPLFRLGPDGSVLPEVVESFSYKDPTTLVLNLHKDVTFHDGEPLNAEAVRWNLDRMIAQKTARAGELGSVASANIVSDYTVELRLKQPDAGLLAILTDRAGMMVSRKAFEQLGADFARKPVGNGPFKFVEWRPNERIALDRNEKFFQKDRPHLDKVLYRITPDPEVRVALIRTGEVDVITEVPSKDIESLSKEAGVKVQQGPAVSFRGIHLNLQAEPFGNKSCRQAVALAIDRDAIHKAVYNGNGEPLYGPLTSAFAGYYDPGFKLNTRDLNGAKAKLAECGKVGGFGFALVTISTPTDQLISQLVASQLAEVNIKVDIQLFDFNAAVKKLTTKDYTALSLGWSGRPDPDGQFLEFPSKSSFNWANYGNPRVDELLVQGKANVDKEKRIALYREAQRLIAEDVPMVFIHAPQYSEVVALRGTVKNFVPILDGLLRFKEVSK